MRVTFRQVIAAYTLTALSSVALAASHIVEMKNAGAGRAPSIRKLLLPSTKKVRMSINARLMRLSIAAW